MKFSDQCLRLYAVTDPFLCGEEVMRMVEDAILGGATCVQLRDKDAPDEVGIRRALAVGAICRKYHVPFILDDRAELVNACQADGVHVGQEDMAATSARALIGDDKILGVSAQTVEQALNAQAAGADYLGVGAVFPTDTKKDAVAVPLSVLSDICRAVCIPVVAIGGISVYNIGMLKGTGVKGAAVVSALFGQGDARLAAIKFTEAMK